MFQPQDYPRPGRYQTTLRYDVPVILLRGAREGQTLLATAAVHGDEFEGVRALFELTQQLEPEEMSGDLIAVPVSNPPAFFNASRLSPLDGLNLARVFPGKEGGSATEAIAWQMDQHLLPHASFYIDLHSAGTRYLMPALVGYDAGDERSAAAARDFGSPILWGHPAIPPGRTVSAAKARHIPHLYTEMRGAGRIDPDDLAFLLRGLRNLLRHLAILPGAPDPAPVRLHLEGDGNIDQSITTTQRGFLIPHVGILDHVEKGQLLGTLHNTHGDCVERFEAPTAGRVILIHAMPLVMPDEPLFLITQDKPNP